MQADLWKQDFDAERAARERQVEEKNSILQEMKNLETKNQQLIDELESYSRKSLAEMQRRHANPTFQKQLQSQLQGSGSGSQGSQMQYPHPSGSPSNYGQQYGQPVFPPALYPPGQPMEHSGGDGSRMTAVNPPQVIELKSFP